MRYQVFSLIFLLTSCATIMHGSRQSIGITSNPSNASVWIDSMYLGNTPIIVELARNNNHSLKIELEGFQPYEAIFTRQLSGWIFGNIIFGGIIGIAVDAVSGAIFRLTPEQIQAEMYYKGYSYSTDTQESFIAVVMEPNPEWTKIGNLVPQ